MLILRNVCISTRATAKVCLELLTNLWRDLLEVNQVDQIEERELGYDAFSLILRQ